MILKFCAEHNSDTAVLCAKFQNNWTTKVGVMDEDFARFEFNMSFWGISYIATVPISLYIKTIYVLNFADGT